MVFSTLMNDVVTLVKADGTRYGNIKATVQAKLILTGDAKLPIEEGDCFERRLPNGTVESYEVLDPGFFAGMSGMPAHFQSKVRRQSRGTPTPKPAQQVVYNVTGDNARINIGATDASTNIVNIQESALFVKLRYAIEQSVEDAEAKHRILVAVAALESEAGKPTFLHKYNEFMAAAANHMTVLAPFVPALTQMLTKTLGG